MLGSLASRILIPGLKALLRATLQNPATRARFFTAVGRAGSVTIKTMDDLWSFAKSNPASFAIVAYEAGKIGLGVEAWLENSSEVQQVVTTPAHLRDGEHEEVALIASSVIEALQRANPEFMQPHSPKGVIDDEEEQRVGDALLRIADALRLMRRGFNMDASAALRFAAALDTLRMADPREVRLAERLAQAH